MPVQAPLQPVKVECPVGAAVSVTISFFQKDSLQSPGQVIPDTSLVIVPVPLPVLVTVNLYLGSAVKVALTVFDAVIVTVQVLPLTLLQPVHLARLECSAGVAVNTTVLTSI